MWTQITVLSGFTNWMDGWMNVFMISQTLITYWKGFFGCYFCFADSSLSSGFSVVLEFASEFLFTPLQQSFITSHGGVLMFIVGGRWKGRQFWEFRFDLIDTYAPLFPSKIISFEGGRSGNGSSWILSRSNYKRGGTAYIFGVKVLVKPKQTIANPENCA